MNPRGCRSSIFQDEKLETYEEGLEKSIKSWNSELKELICKIEASLYKEKDKRKAIKNLLSTLITTKLF